MAQQASWIRQNMFPNQSCPSSKLDVGNKQNNNRRPLTEAEIRVQKSLEKLSIPAWYLNNSSKPPKILMYNSPIDTREPSWRRSHTNKKKNASSSPILNERKLSDSGSPQTTPSKNRESEGKKITQIINRMDTWQIQSPAKTPVKYTQSFPKKSRSRKITNINLIFSPPPKSQHKDDNNNQVLKNSSLNVENSLYQPSINESELEKSVRVTDVDKLLESMDQSLNVTNELKMCNMENWNNDYYGISDCSSAILLKENNEIRSKSNGSTVLSISESNSCSADSISTTPLLSPHCNEKMCDECQAYIANPVVTSPYRYLPGSTHFKSRSKLMPIEEDKETNQRAHPTYDDAVTDFLTTPKKSTAMEQIVKQNMSGGTGLIQEIIQEFQKKCKKTPNQQFTRGSKKFVKKLVKVLEKSINEDYDESEADDNIQQFQDIQTPLETENIHDIDIKSVTSSATISLKGSDCDYGQSQSSSPTLSTSPDYTWGMQVPGEIHSKMKKTQTNRSDKVRWISLPSDVGLPRTSSALSMKSRSSSRSSSNKSPCLSPITQDNEQPHFFINNNNNNNNNNKEHWNWSYSGKNIKTRRLLGKDKPITVFDSGYAEKSEHSFIIQSFLAEYEASQLSSDLDTSENRRLSFNQASSIFTKPIHV